MSSNRSSGAVGLTYFAAFMLIMIGFFHAIAVLSWILKDEFYVKTTNYLINLDASGWGWIHLIVGIVIWLIRVCFRNPLPAPRTTAPAPNPTTTGWVPWFPSVLMCIATGAPGAWASGRMR